MTGGAPFDPFQFGGPLVSDPVQKLAQRWAEITRQLDDRAFELTDPGADDARVTKLWDERDEVRDQLFAIAEPTIASVALKLRIVAWHMNVEKAHCANHDGVRTNELEPDEKIIASALADAERLAGVAA